MPDTEQNQETNTELEEVTAVDFALEAANAMAEFRDDWGAIKDNMLSWLKANVGENIDSMQSHLRDTIIEKAKIADDDSHDAFQQTFDHLYRITQNPMWDVDISTAEVSQEYVDSRKLDTSEETNGT